MTKYNAIENEIRESYKEKGKNIRFYIHHGYMASWSDEDKKESDEGIKEYSTDYRWKQYQGGKISREKAVEYAVIRALKKLEKELWTDLERLEAIENAKTPSFISIKTEWVKSRTLVTIRTRWFMCRGLAVMRAARPAADTIKKAQLSQVPQKAALHSKKFFVS